MDFAEETKEVPLFPWNARQNEAWTSPTNHQNQSLLPSGFEIVKAKIKFVCKFPLQISLHICPPAVNLQSSASWIPCVNYVLSPQMNHTETKTVNDWGQLFLSSFFASNRQQRTTEQLLQMIQFFAFYWTFLWNKCTSHAVGCVCVIRWPRGDVHPSRKGQFFIFGQNQGQTLCKSMWTELTIDQDYGLIKYHSEFQIPSPSDIALNFPLSPSDKIRWTSNPVFFFVFKMSLALAKKTFQPSKSFSTKQATIISYQYVNSTQIERILFFPDMDPKTNFLPLQNKQWC